MNPHELQALAAVLAREAGEDDKADQILSLNPSALAALLPEGGAGDSAGTFPGTHQHVQ